MIPKGIFSKELNIEITNKCKLKCPLCMRQQSPYKLADSSEIGFKELKKVFDSFKKLNFCGQMSDPIYHSEFLEILKYINENNSAVINTNGHGHTKEWWLEAFKNKNIRWIFGIDGLPKDSHKYRVGQDGEQVFEMMKLGASMGVQILWNYIMFNYNENDYDKAKQLAEENGIVIRKILSNRFNEKNLSLRPFKTENYIKRKNDENNS